MDRIKYYKEPPNKIQNSYSQGIELKDKNQECYKHISKRLNDAVNQLEMKFGRDFKSLQTEVNLSENTTGSQFLRVRVIKSTWGKPVEAQLTIFKPKAIILGLVYVAIQEKRDEGYSNLWFSL